MSLVKKKNWYLDYLLIIAGTGLMALAINSVFDATGLVTRWFFRYCDPGETLDWRNCRWRDPAVAYQYYAEHPVVLSGVQDQRIFLCKKSSGWRDIPLDLACHSAGVEYCRR